MPVKKIQKNNKIEPKTVNNFLKNQINAVVFLAAAVFIFAGIQFTTQTGLAGFVLNMVFRILCGEAALAIPFFFTFVAFGFLWSARVENFPYRLTGILIVFALLVVSLHLRLTLQELQGMHGRELYRSMLTLGLQQQGGGVLGAVFAVMLFFFFKDLGSYIIISALGVVALLLLTNCSIIELVTAASRPWRYLVNTGCYLWRNAFSGEDLKEVENTEPPIEYPVRQYDDLPKEEQTLRDNEIINEKKELALQKEEPPVVVETLEAAGSTPEPRPLLAAPVTENTIAAAEEENEQMLNGVFEVNSFPEDYKLPRINLLTRVNKLRDYQQQKVIQERARALENTFASFGVKVKIKEIQAGPAVTRYEVQPETGVKVSRILSLSDDLALNMAAPHVRIEAPIPGKAAVGIEVPNKIISLVYIREVLEDALFKDATSPLIVGLGKDIAGTPVFADLLKMPHLLIAGATGSGKSVCINSLICSILFKAEPWKVKFLLIDPKMVELNVYNGIPHLISPVVTDAKKSAIALRNMVREMERRYDLFARQGVRDIGRYNELSQVNMLPYIVVVIDELSDLMMVSPSEVEDSIVRLSQMSRAAGIHLVIATQRPSVDVITGLIKANITSRIAFAVSSQTDSRTILDVGGAEKLLGRGDMLYHPLGIHKPLRVQGAFVSESDIFKVVEFIKQQGSPLYQQSFFNGEETEDLPVMERDELLPEVVELIMQAGHASISLIQRRFRIGYTRAARIVDDLERLGIIGKYEGSKPRQVLIGREQAGAILAGKDDRK
ncbi:MAG: DNA translocase FtsK [Bacillota bacterium]